MPDRASRGALSLPALKGGVSRARLMKCPECGHNHRAREGKRCSQCRYQFVFEKNKDSLRDNQFMMVVRQLSEDGRYSFTPTQLSLAVTRKSMETGCLGAVLGLVAGGLTFIAVDLNHVLAFLLAVAVAFMVGFIYYRLFPTAKGSYREARRMVDRYHRAHPLAQMATGGAFAHPGPETALEPGFAPERILVVDREDLADALIRNGFHREQRCVVLTVDGYPEHVFAACRTFVKRHPEVPIYVLHDASAHGFRLVKLMEKRPEWRFARDRLRDLGITREQLVQARRRRLPWLLKGGEMMKLSKDHEGMLGQSGWLPVDYPPPAILQGALAGALVAGILVLPDPVMAGTDSGGPDGGSG